MIQLNTKTKSSNIFPSILKLSQQARYYICETTQKNFNNFFTKRIKNFWLLSMFFTDGISSNEPITFQTKSCSKYVIYYLLTQSMSCAFPAKNYNHGSKSVNIQVFLARTYVSSKIRSVKRLDKIRTFIFKNFNGFVFTCRIDPKSVRMCLWFSGGKKLDRWF